MSLVFQVQKGHHIKMFNHSHIDVETEPRMGDGEN